MKRGFSEKESKEIVSNFQVRNKSYFVRKYGEDEGSRRYESFRNKCKISLSNFIRIYGPEEGLKKFQSFKKDCSGSLENFIKRHGEEGRKLRETSTEKWLNTLNKKSEEEKRRINKRKAVNLTNLINKYGEVEGVKRYDHFLSTSKLGRSKISQELFKILFDLLDVKENIYFADLNHEYVLYNKNLKRVFLLDFVYNNNCIEFNGDKWHGNPSFYKKTDCPRPSLDGKSCEQIWYEDELKNNIIKEKFNLLIIWENEFVNNKNETIQKCIKFLTSNR
jgi:hypothetical protein